MPVKAKKKPKKDSKRKARKKGGLTAKTADKFVLYEKSVQEPEADIDFMDRIFRKKRGRKPLSLREDFCGTAWLSADWVKSNKKRTAVGLDLDAPTLAWAREHHVEPLGAAAERVTLVQGDVMDGHPGKFDFAVAFNFSYWIFQERQTLLRYFRSVRPNLHRDGAFIIDIHGGPDAQEEVEEDQKKKGFTYVWQQEPMDAVSGRSIRHIHFQFPDGSEMRKAFTYDWRVWSLPELRDLLYEAGYDKVEVYWEEADDEGEGTGVFKKVNKVENEECWIAYIVAWANP